MSDEPRARGLHAPGGPTEARAALLRWVDDAGMEGGVFLQVRIRREADGGYEIRHRDDVERAADALARSTDPYAAREIAQTDARGEHRPLKTAPTLRRGWRLEGLDGHGLWTALNYLYPACAVHWHAGRTGTLRVTHWRETAGRQSGIYSSVRLLPDPVVRTTVRACCGDAVCLRRVAWEIDEDTPLDLAPEAEPEGALVPCPEACSMFISFARTVLTLERSPRQPVPGLGTLATGEVGQLREIVAAAAAGTLGATREGDFAEATNSRRIRYLAARLAEARTEPVEKESIAHG